MNKNEKCFIKILQSKTRKFTTSQILNATDLYPELCSGCKSGSHVITAGQSLIKQGKVLREVGKGGFYWSLTD
ncbi:MAG: hypothetical protein IH840_07975 [Candidatus Heimdallarchaeota archaeon]|nr:hypothetical protein [Candidatus Heimdallarchaeota archaeon]